MSHETETYGLRELIFDDFLPIALEFQKVGTNPNTTLSVDESNRPDLFRPNPLRLDDPNASLIFGVQLNQFQLAGLAVAAALTLFLVFK